MIRTEQEINHEIEQIHLLVKSHKGDERMKIWFEGQLKALYWVLGLAHMDAYSKSTGKEVEPCKAKTTSL